MTEIIQQIALLKIKGLGPYNCRKLISDFNGLQQLFEGRLRLFSAKYEKRGLEIYRKIQLAKKELINAEKIFFECELSNIKICSYYDKSYPKQLKQCHDAPQLIFYSGKNTFNSSPLISIVGTRDCSEYGLRLVKEICANLKNFNVTVVSGLAKGIDYSAHYNAIKNNLTTYAILGHGHKHIYPKYHSDMFNLIKENGSLISEFEPSTIPSKFNFPKRNRIIAGIADATLVVESKERGGSLITARIANSYNKDVFAIPGKVNSANSKGCNKLISNNEALLINSASEIIKLMGLKKKVVTNQVITVPDGLSKTEEKVMHKIISYPNYNTDEISTLLSMNSHELQSQLTTLELKGAIKLLFGKKIKILN